LTQTEKTIELDVAKVARLLPNAVCEYRTNLARLRDGRSTVSDAEYIETRELLFDRLGGSVPVKPGADGSAALSLDIDVSPIAKAYGSMTYKLVAGARFTSFRQVIPPHRIPVYFIEKRDFDFATTTTHRQFAAR